MIKIKRYWNYDSYLEDIVSFLSLDEAANNMALGTLLAQKGRNCKENDLLLAVFENKTPVLALQNLDRALLVTGDENYTGSLLDYLTAIHWKINALLGESKLVKSMAHTLCNKTGNKFRVAMDQRIYKLDTVNDIALASGNLRPAKLSEQDLISDFIAGFNVALGEELSAETSLLHANNIIKSGSLYVWDNGKIVSMAKKSRPTNKGVAINFVFTPVEHRGKGYASSCVARLSSLLLEDFDFCCLYTDLSNPSSNRIYQAIGYNPVSDSCLIEIDYSN